MKEQKQLAVCRSTYAFLFFGRRIWHPLLEIVAYGYPSPQETLQPPIRTSTSQRGTPAHYFSLTMDLEKVP